MKCKHYVNNLKLLFWVGALLIFRCLLRTHLCVPPAQQEIGGITVIKLLLFQGFLHHGVGVAHALQDLNSFPVVPILDWLHIRL